MEGSRDCFVIVCSISSSLQLFCDVPHLDSDGRTCRGSCSKSNKSMVSSGLSRGLDSVWAVRGRGRLLVSNMSRVASIRFDDRQFCDTIDLKPAMIEQNGDII